MLALALEKFKVDVHFNLLVDFRIENWHDPKIESFFIFLLSHKICKLFLSATKLHRQKFKRTLFVEVIGDWLGLIKPITFATFGNCWHSKQYKKSNYSNYSVPIVEYKHVRLIVKLWHSETFGFRDICIGRHYRRIRKTKCSSEKEKYRRVLKVVVHSDDYAAFELMRLLV